MASQPESDPKPKTPKKPRRDDSDSSDEDQRPPFPVPWLLIMVLGVILVFYMFQENPRSHGNSGSYDFFRSQLDEDNVKSASVYNDKNLVTGSWKEAPVNPKKSSEKLSDEFNVDLPESVVQDKNFIDSLIAQGIETRAKSNQEGGGELFLLWMLGPLM